MSKRYQNSFTCRGSVILILFVLLIPFVLAANSEGEIAITTTSEKARQVFLEGLTLSQNLRVDEARARFEKAIEKDPNFAQAYMYLAFSASSNSDFQNYFDKAVALAPKVSKGEQMMIEGWDASFENNNVKARKIFEKLVMEYPNDKRAHQFLGNIYSFLEMDDKAIAQFKKTIEIDKDFAPAYNLLGYAYMQTEDFQNAEQAFKNYIRLIPDEANPHDSIADLYTKMGRHKDAVKHFEKSVELNPMFYISQQKIGTNLVFMGRYEEGRKAIQKAMNMESPISAKVSDMNQIALTHLYEGNFALALETFDKAIKMAKDADLSVQTANLYSQKCNVHLEMGELIKAEECIQTCNEIVMQSDMRQSFKNNFMKSALAQEALIAAKNHNFERAMAKAEKHLAKIKVDNDPTEMKEHHNLLGLIHFEKGDYTQARQHLGKGDQEDPYILFHLAVAESMAGDRVKAAKLFRKVADMNQNNLGYALVRSKAMAREMMAEKE